MQCLYRLKWEGICGATCSVWGLFCCVGNSNRILKKPPHLSVTGAARMSPWAGRGEKKLTPCHANKSKHWWWPWLFFPSFHLCSNSTFFLHRYKANRVWTLDRVRVNTGCCDVCVVSEPTCVWGEHSWYRGYGGIFFFSCRVRCFE